MNILITGSAGHLGEALTRHLSSTGHEVRGLDINASPFTTHVGSITDPTFVRQSLDGIQAVIHAATLHKPHIATHSRQDFVDTNITGTLTLLEEAMLAGVTAFVFTSTTSVFGDALRPPADEPAAWITEDVQPMPKNIYGVTKAAAEDLVALFHRSHGLNGVVLRTSRFFPEEDDDAAVRERYPGNNAKANEFLFRRVDIEDVAGAHERAIERAPALGFDRFIISATTPFRREDLEDLRRDAAAVVRRRCRPYEDAYRRCGWTMFPTIDRVYVNARARNKLGWTPRYDFDAIVERLLADRPITSPLASEVGAKGYHDRTFAEGPYPVDREGNKRC